MPLEMPITLKDGKDDEDVSCEEDNSEEEDSEEDDNDEEEEFEDGEGDNGEEGDGEEQEDGGVSRLIHAMILACFIAVTVTLLFFAVLPSYALR